MTFSRILAVVIVVAAALWIGSGVLFGGGHETTADASPAAAEAAAPFKVAVVDAQLSDHSRTLTVSGRTESDDRASAMARAAGSIVSIAVKRGDTVKEGDVIASLSDEARQAQVDQARALVEQRKVDLQAKQRLIERGVAPANQKNQIEADLRAAEATLALAEAENERGLVRAPISGVVSNLPMRAGQALQAGTMVAEVVALDPMLAVAEISEMNLGAVHVGDIATARLVTGQSVEGRVRFVSPTASAGTRTYRVEVELPNTDHAIADGVTAEIEFRLAAVASTRIPRSALVFSDAGALSVRAVDADNVVGSVPVTIVEDARDSVWVAGPKDDTRVIVQGQDFVKDGERVEPVAATASADEPQLRPAS